jgi:hypothetical protein
LAGTGIAGLSSSSFFDVLKFSAGVREFSFRRRFYEQRASLWRSELQLIFQTKEPLIMKFSLIALAACCAVAGSAFALADDQGVHPPRLALTDDQGVHPPRLALTDDQGVHPPRLTLTDDQGVHPPRLALTDDQGVHPPRV